MDLIDRQKTIEMLEGMKVKDPFDRYEKRNIGIDWAIDAIKAASAAQPEIIRCKDCKYHRYEHDKTGDIPYCSNADYGYGWKDNDFCSKGKRRTDE